MKFLCCIIIPIFLTFACGDPTFPKVVKKPPSQEEFDMLITEQGKKLTEKIIFDMTKKTVVHQVPAHRNLNESNVMKDFVSNLTITRIPIQRVCYVRSMTPDEPSLDVLKKSLEKVSSQKYKMKAGFTTIATQWVIKGQADPTRLGKGVIEFCRGMKIYEVEEYAHDSAKVHKALSRKKREDWILCYNEWDTIREDLKRCKKSERKVKCRFTAKDCFYYVTCTGGRVDMRHQCTSIHTYDEFVCCTPFCP